MFPGQCSAETAVGAFPHSALYLRSFYITFSKPQHSYQQKAMPPPTTADLIFSPQANHNFSQTLSSLKRSTLSIHARLTSILEDAAFAQQVGQAYGRPLVANERCGSWYIDPEKKAGSVYFKSTDGHTGVWKFSLRRLNLHLLDIVGRNDGLVPRTMDI